MTQVQCAGLEAAFKVYDDEIQDMEKVDQAAATLTDSTQSVADRIKAVETINNLVSNGSGAMSDYFNKVVAAMNAYTASVKLNGADSTIRVIDGTGNPITLSDAISNPTMQFYIDGDVTNITAASPSYLGISAKDIMSMKNTLSVINASSPSTPTSSGGQWNVGLLNGKVFIELTGTMDQIGAQNFSADAGSSSAASALQSIHG